MHVGLTYDLKDHYRAQGFDAEAVAELDAEDTVHAIAGAVEAMGHRVERVGHLSALAERLVAGARWDLVFNIAEGVRGQARESQVPALLDAYGVPYTFSDPLVLAVCLDKRLAKLVVRDHGVATPDFAVVSEPGDVGRVTLEGPLFAKPLCEGSSRGVTAASRVPSRAELGPVCRDLLARYRQPVLVERYLPGRELTVGVLGTGAAAEVLGALEVCLGDRADPGVYSYENKQQYLDRVSYRLADDAGARAAADLAVRAHRALGCRDASRVDVRFDEHGAPSFIEVNPLPGLNPVTSDLAILAGTIGLGYEALLGRVLQSAADRRGPCG